MTYSASTKQLAYMAVLIDQIRALGAVDTADALSAHCKDTNWELGPASAFITDMKAIKERLVAKPAPKPRAPRSPRRRPARRA